MVKYLKNIMCGREWLNNVSNSRRNNISNNYTLFVLNIIIFAVCVGIYLINKTVPTEDYGFRQMYLNDLLAMPLLLSYAQMIHLISGRLLKVIPILLILNICCIMWEVVTPALWSKSVGDYLDVVQYVNCTIIYISINSIVIWIKDRKKGAE